MTASHWTPKGQRARHPACELDVLDRVIVTPEGCWIWTGGTSGGSRPYPRILRPGTRNMMAAHRFTFKLLRPKILFPDDWELDHLCADWCARWSGDRSFHRLCVNPEHLEPVPPAINQARKWAAIYARRYGDDAAEWKDYAIHDGSPIPSFEQELEHAFD